MFVDPTHGTRLIAIRDDLNYFHHKEAEVAADLIALDAYTISTTNISWPLRMAFKIRDKISALAGVKAIHGFEPAKSGKPIQVGDMLDFFTVETISDQELALTSRDKHLSVMVAFKLIRLKSDNQRLSVTTSVKVHNFFGKLYMLPVAPVHSVIIPRMMRKVELS